MPTIIIVLCVSYFLIMAKGGYSGTPLMNKLGIKPGMKLLLINQPEK